ncbi:MAG TPA: SDR family oxidoreductase [Stellaceae bacterium]|jgi:NAD(P)-dependent dehydrogenase (short-subunit alcohol dehydrogenase family)
MAALAPKILEGKIALVTGASRGIGRAIAVRLGAEGALVGVHYRKDEAAAKSCVAAIAAAGGAGFAIAADLAAHDGPERLFAAFDAALPQHDAKLDILVNNAGIGSRAPIDTATGNEFDKLVAVNLRAPFFIMQKALPRLADGGRIVNVTSTAARIGYAETPAYTATKAALQALTLSVARRLGPRGITVNAVAPGATDTDMNALVRDPLSAKQIAGETILGRIGQPGDIAEVVTFLASDAARWITGQVIEASGGLRL